MLLTQATIDRPLKANSYNSRVLRKLEKLIDDCHRSEIRVVVFRSSNPRFFSSGADRGRIANPQLRDGKLCVDVVEANDGVGLSFNVCFAQIPNLLLVRRFVFGVPANFQEIGRRLLRFNCRR